jgi:hypothetical protein
VFVKVNGETHHLWRAADHEGEILESYVTKKREKSEPFRFLKKALKPQYLVEFQLARRPREGARGLLRCSLSHCCVEPSLRARRVAGNRPADKSNAGVEPCEMATQPARSFWCQQPCQRLDMLALLGVQQFAPQYAQITHPPVPSASL